MELNENELQKQGDKLLKKKCSGLHKIGGGRNSRVYKYESGEDLFLLKSYHVSQSDSRNRVKTEFNASKFMWNNGIRQIPQPIAVDIKNSVAVYTFIDGEKLNANKIGHEEITTLSSFLTQLNSLKTLALSNNLNNASEACFTLEYLFDNIEERLKKIQKYDFNLPYGEELKELLENKIRPAFQSLKQEALNEYRQKEIPFHSLSLESRTLSPSDFGFHNALVNKNKGIFFFDFEYFGIDDPVKTVSDFLLHPIMDLTEEAYITFLRNMTKVYKASDSLFEPRLIAFYPLYAIKWCTILLNEFTPENYERRQFSLGEFDHKKALKSQLNKTNLMLEKSKLAKQKIKKWLKNI